MNRLHAHEINEYMNHVWVFIFYLHLSKNKTITNEFSMKVEFTM